MQFSPQLFWGENKQNFLHHAPLMHYPQIGHITAWCFIYEDAEEQIMKILITWSIIFWLLATPVLLFAQDDHSHETESQHTSDNRTPEEGNTDSGSVFAPFGHFPNLHPLIVHFPVVLLPLALIAQLTGLFYHRKTLSWFTMIILAGGFAGAVLAAQFFHPHAGGLPDNVKEIFETHEHYALWTQWLAGIALLVKVISHFFLNRKTWTEVLAMLLIAGTAVTVSLAGHLGSQMVYLHEVGPAGNYMMEEHEH